MRIERSLVVVCDFVSITDATSSSTRQLTSLLNHKNVYTFAIELLEDLVLRLNHNVRTESDHFPTPLIGLCWIGFDWTHNVLLILGDLLGETNQELLKLERRGTWSALHSYNTSHPTRT